MKDQFSGQAALYAKYRPAYPATLFDFIFQHLSSTGKAWDCGTGNGQTASVLAGEFREVYATDISQQQLDHAIQADNIFYSLQPAERTNFHNDQFDLVTVSQALHWFAFDEFYTEVKRVLKNQGWIAAWMYGLLRVHPEIDPLIDHYHYQTLENYWEPERKFIDEAYQSIPFPFSQIACPPFYISYDWTIPELAGYLRTWSARQKFMSIKQYDPVDDVIDKINPLWGSGKRTVRFPVWLRMGRLDK